MTQLQLALGIIAAKDLQIYNLQDKITLMRDIISRLRAKNDRLQKDVDDLLHDKLVEYNRQNKKASEHHVGFKTGKDEKVN